MKISKRFVSTLPCIIAIVLSVAVIGAPLSTTSAQTQQLECANGAGGQFKAVALAAPRIATVDFSGSGGQLDPVALLETEIKTGPTCVLVHFSAQADPQDNFAVFQASIDDIPMEGHAQFPYLTPAPTTPVVFDPEETNLNVSRMVSYTFFARVDRGSHMVRVRFAGCCSPNPGSGLVRAAVMSVNY
jgi:hypothetical protein